MALFGAALALVACGSTQNEGPNNGLDAFMTVKTASPSDVPPKAAPQKEEDLTPDQKEQMEIALRRGGEKVKNCGSVVPDSARGEGEVTVVFDGKKGRAVDVNVGPPWVGTDAENCIKRAFIDEIIVPFEGTLEVPYTVKIPKKEGDITPDKGKPKPKGKGK